MANNRLLIRCKGCSGFQAWAKFYPTGTFIGGPDDDPENTGWYTNVEAEDFNSFFREHERHNKMDNYGSFWDLMDENDDRIKLLNWSTRKLTIKSAK